MLQFLSIFVNSFYSFFIEEILTHSKLKIINFIFEMNLFENLSQCKAKTFVPGICEDVSINLTLIDFENI